MNSYPEVGQEVMYVRQSSPDDGYSYLLDKIGRVARVSGRNIYVSFNEGTTLFICFLDELEYTTSDAAQQAARRNHALKFL